MASDSPKKKFSKRSILSMQSCNRFLRELFSRERRRHPIYQHLVCRVIDKMADRSCACAQRRQGLRLIASDDPDRRRGEISVNTTVSCAR